MNNSLKYHFGDFTRKNFSKILKKAKEKYKFINYGIEKPVKNTIYLRHDIDFSVNSALALARIENKLKIKATYFILPHSDFYNLLEPEIFSIIKKIINLGHNIGLHFDSQFYGIKDEKSLVQALKLERDFFRKLFNIKIDVFSFHNPDKFALSCRKYRYSGMVNTYADFFNKEVSYISDSNGYWRHNRLEDFLKSASDKPIQILLHPEWWQEKIMSPKERVWRCIEGRAAKTKIKYIGILKKFKRSHIDW